MTRFIVSYWIEAPSPYLVIDTEANTNGETEVIGGFTADKAHMVAAALNEKGKAEALESELRRANELLDQAGIEWPTGADR